MSKTEKEKDYLCNLCGETTLIRGDSGISKDGVDRTSWSEDYGVLIGYETGYFSKYLPDGHNYRFRLCERCLSVLFPPFEIPPAEAECLGGWCGCYDELGGLKPEKE